MKFDYIYLGGSDTITLFDRTNPRSTPYIVRNIDGLGPTDIDVTLAQTSQGQGLYIGRREQLREITINAILNPEYRINETPQSLRETIYRLRPINEDMSLNLVFGWQDPGTPPNFLDAGLKVVAYAPVYVKRVETVPFSKEQSIQIVLASTSGYLSGPAPVSLFDFDTSRTSPVFDNEGSADTGFKLVLDFTSRPTYFHLQQTAPTVDLYLTRYVGDPYLFDVGDRLEINTNIGERGIRRQRSGIWTNILGNLTPSSGWISLHPGPNQLSLFTDAVAVAPSVEAFWWKELTHTPKFTGV